MTANVNQKFTGQERDPEMTPNTDFFNARYFSAVAGSFLRPDPGNAGARPTNPQSWNGYAYVAGNPLALVDPSGMTDVTTPGSHNDCGSGWDPAWCGGGGGRGAGESVVRSMETAVWRGVLNVGCGAVP